MYPHHTGTSKEIRTVLHPLIDFTAHAGCMAQPDNATLIVSLHLQHPDAIVQLCSDCVRACHSPISYETKLCTYCFGPGSKPLTKRIIRASLSKKLCLKKQERALTTGPNSIRIVRANEGNVPVALRAELSMTVAYRSSALIVLGRQRKARG